jgi:hypothetical protein
MADLAFNQSVYLSRAAHLSGLDRSSFSLVLDELYLLWGSYCGGFTMGKLLWDSSYVPIVNCIATGPDEVEVTLHRHDNYTVLKVRRRRSQTSCQQGILLNDRGVIPVKT